MRHTPSELRRMAQTALGYRDTLHPDWLRLLFQLMLHTGLSADRVEREIERLAAGA